MSNLQIKTIPKHIVFNGNLYELVDTNIAVVEELSVVSKIQSGDENYCDIWLRKQLEEQGND